MRALILSGIPELVLLAVAFSIGGGVEYLSILAAAIIHELGHVFAAAVVGVKMRLCKTGIAGISLSYDFSAVSPAKEAIVCLAGPVAGFTVLIIAYCIGNTSYFVAASLGLTVFNLLPISFLDGGCALSALLTLTFTPDKVWYICRGLSVVFTMLLWGVSVMLILRANGDFSLIMAAVYLLYRLFSES